MQLLKETPVFLIGCLLTGLIFLFWAPEKKNKSDSHSGKSHHGSEHSQTSKTLNEADLNIITLSPIAVKRLGIETAPVEVRDMPRTRTYGAEMVLPTGAAVIVSAPLAGTLNHPPEHAFPQVGQRVAKDETILELLPLLSPERAVLTPAERIRFAEAKAAVAQSQIDAEGQLQQALVQQEAARIQLERSQRLLQNNVGTRKAVDDAQAQMKLAEEVLAAARSRKKLVDHIQLDEAAGTLKPMTIRSPLAGIVRTTSVQPGQLISAGAPLFEVMNSEQLWVKVPVYAGELDEIDAGQPVRITLLDGHFSQQDVMGKPVSLPPTALPLSSAVDLYYEIDNHSQRYRPGQKVSVTVPLKGKTNVKSIPWSALIYDVYGGQWVYERLGDNEFARRRVEAGWVDQDRIAILRGPDAGTKIVTAGAAELMGTEFGFAK